LTAKFQTGAFAKLYGVTLDSCNGPAANCLCSEADFLFQQFDIDFV